MKRFNDEPTTIRVLATVVCDRCKHEVSDTGTEAYREMQEFVTVFGEGGYASQHWGDCSTWRVDLCEKCQFELFSPIASRNTAE